MFIYSEGYSLFVDLVKTTIKQIMSSELKLKTMRERFQYGNYIYRINVALFEDDKKLGFFDSTKYLIAINKVFYFDPDINNLKNVLRHEIAHLLLLYNLWGIRSIIMDLNFEDFCKKYGWEKGYFTGQAIYEATHFERFKQMSTREAALMAIKQWKSSEL
ncbi:MAG: hypothetical protein U0T83_08215 [Bacteriovoracaceae bacterium]